MTAKKTKKRVSPLKKKPEDRIRPYFCRFYTRQIGMIKNLAKLKKLPEALIVREAIEKLYAAEGPRETGK